MTALLEKPLKRVSPLKAGRSSRIKASTSPVTFVDPTGLEWFPLSSMKKDCAAQNVARGGPFLNGALKKMGEHAEFKKLRDGVLVSGVSFSVGDLGDNRLAHYTQASHSITINSRFFGVDRSSCPDKMTDGIEELLAAVMVHEMTHAQQALNKTLFGRGVWEPELEAFKAEGRFIKASWGGSEIGYLMTSTRADLAKMGEQASLMQVLPLMNDQALKNTFGIDYLQNPNGEIR